MVRKEASYRKNKNKKSGYAVMCGSLTPNVKGGVCAVLLNMSISNLGNKPSDINEYKDLI